MLSQDLNEKVSQVGPGTPMGALMREYWLPALQSAELPQPDSDPVRIRLLGEDLIAFRQTDGTVGLVQQACPHRRASLFYGRNEEQGLRCVYHGWKFDAAGHCVDMPSEPAESNFKAKIRITAYPCVERNGVVWAYLGPRSTPPELPVLEPNVTPGATINCVLRSCNWLQALEGDIDTSHLGFLHLGAVEPEDTKPESFDYYTVKDRAPRYHVVDTDYGTMYGAYRPAQADSYYWRTAAFLFPVWTMIPTGVLGLKNAVRGWVPLDDDHTMFWSITIDPGSGRSGGARRPGQGFEFQPNTTDWLGHWRLTREAANDYLIDRSAQRARQSYTGITGIHTEDQAITESMGPLADRTQERLGSSDIMIIRTRQRLLKAVDAHQQGTPPPGVDDPEVFATRTGSVFLPRETDWLEGTAELRKAFVEHPEVQEAARAGRY